MEEVELNVKYVPVFLFVFMGSRQIFFSQRFPMASLMTVIVYSKSVNSGTNTRGNPKTYRKTFGTLFQSNAE